MIWWKGYCFLMEYLSYTKLRKGVSWLGYFPIKEILYWVKNVSCCSFLTLILIWFDSDQSSEHHKKNTGQATIDRKLMASDTQSQQLCFLACYLCMAGDVVVGSGVRSLFQVSPALACSKPVSGSQPSKYIRIKGTDLPLWQGALISRLVLLTSGAPWSRLL